MWLLIIVSTLQETMRIVRRSFPHGARRRPKLDGVYETYSKRLQRRERYAAKSVSLVRLDLQRAQTVLYSCAQPVCVRRTHFLFVRATYTRKG